MYEGENQSYKVMQDKRRLGVGESKLRKVVYAHFKACAAILNK